MSRKEERRKLKSFLETEKRLMKKEMKIEHFLRTNREVFGALLFASLIKVINNKEFNYLIERFNNLCNKI